MEPITERVVINMEKENQRIHENHFDRFMFGPNRNRRQAVPHKAKRKSSISPDFAAIIENIDTLMDSAQNLKPLVKKVYPIVEQFWKK